MKKVALCAITFQLIIICSCLSTGQKSVGYRENVTKKTKCRGKWVYPCAVGNRKRSDARDGFQQDVERSNNDEILESAQDRWERKDEDKDKEADDRSQTSNADDRRASTTPSSPFKDAVKKKIKCPGEWKIGCPGGNGKRSDARDGFQQDVERSNNDEMLESAQSRWERKDEDEDKEAGDQIQTSDVDDLPASSSRLNDAVINNDEIPKYSDKDRRYTNLDILMLKRIVDYLVNGRQDQRSRDAEPDEKNKEED